LRRSRLVDFIHQTIDRQLFLVVAPAGYGKTTLLVDFASDGHIPVCWYSLGASDAEPAVFLEYLVDCIKARFPRFGAETRRVIAQAADLRAELLAVVGAFVNDVQRHIPDVFVLVLDDYHEVNDSQVIGELLDLLLRHAPENLKLILSSRSMPRLRLSRMAAMRQAAGVGSNDLRFTVDEVRTLMRDKYQTPLSDRAAEELASTSEGWITGIILTTHTMWQGLFESMIQGSGQEQLYAYLANEVFERQPSVVQRFLLASCVLEDMEPAVAGELAGVRGAAQVFRRLEDDNLFVTRIDGRQRAYRYHHLFRDFLRSRLGQEGSGRVQALQRHAGELYAARGDHELAIGHLLAADAFDPAAASIAAIADDMFNRGRLDTLATWIDALPADLLNRQPRLTLLRAQVAIQKGELEPAIRLCRQAELAARGLADPGLEAEGKVNRAAALRLGGDNEGAIRLCQEALAVFGDEVSKRRALALRTSGTCNGRMGRLENAWEKFEESQHILEHMDDPASLAYVRNDLGTVAVLRGDLERGRRHFGRSAAFWEQVGNEGRHAMTLSNLGVIAYLQEDYAEAVSLLQEARLKAQRAHFPHMQVAAACSLGDVYRDTGNFGHALALYDEALTVGQEVGDQGELAALLLSMAQAYRLQDLPAKVETTLKRLAAVGVSSGYVAAQSKLVAAMCSIEQGRYRRARRLLLEALAAFRQAGARYPAARCLFHLALLELSTGHPADSDKRLSECLAILEDLGYHQFLTVDGRRSLPFIRRAADRGIGEAFLARLLPKLEAPLPSAATALSAPKVPAEAPPRRVEVRAFGRPEVRVDGRLVPHHEWGTQSARDLFFFLLLHPTGVSK
ncbi:MAG: tetratricopeptide repeat protein, partial [Chloroflexota bacterium]